MSKQVVFDKMWMTFKNLQSCECSVYESMRYGVPTNCTEIFNVLSVHIGALFNWFLIQSVQFIILQKKRYITCTYMFDRIKLEGGSYWMYYYNQHSWMTLLSNSLNTRNPIKIYTLFEPPKFGSEHTRSGFKAHYLECDRMSFINLWGYWS